MKALLFPGQGAQFSKMSLDLCEKYPELSSMIDEASDIAGFDVRGVINAEVPVKQTEFLQISLFVSSLITFKAIQKSGKLKLDNVKYILGHSLGEYSALCAFGSISFEDAIKILRVRSQLMAEASIVKDDQLVMASVLGADFKTVELLLKDYFKNNNITQNLFIANYNSKSQIVLGGALSSLEEFKIYARDTLRKIITLPVSGAFHTSYMQEASTKFATFLEDFHFKDLIDVAIVMNNDAKPETNGKKIKEKLISNICNPILFWPAIMFLLNMVNKVIEVGGSGILTRMLQREEINGIKFSHINSNETINNFH